MRQQILDAAEAAIAKDGPRATLKIYLAGQGRKSRRLEAVRGAPWGTLVEDGDLGFGVYEFAATEVVEWLEGRL